MKNSTTENFTHGIAKPVLCDVFSLFVADDERRPVMLKPFEVDDYYVATDSHSLVRVKKDLCGDFEVKNEHGNLKIKHLFHEYNQNQILNITVDLEKYRTGKELKEVGEDIKCTECDGFGEVEWEYENWTKDFDCPKCDGIGFMEESKEVETGNYVFSDDKIIKIKGLHFSLKNIERIIKLKKMINEEIVIKFVEKGKGATFEIGIFTVILMPIIISDESAYTVVENIA